MISTALICAILFIFLDVVILLWILQIVNYINNFQSQESTLCPVYFCDQYTDPSTGELEPGSLCYVNTPGADNLMVAYRYTNSSTYECQKYSVNDNIITDQIYLPQSEL